LRRNELFINVVSEVIAGMLFKLNPITLI